MRVRVCTHAYAYVRMCAHMYMRARHESNLLFNPYLSLKKDMALQYNTRTQARKIPITRNSKFFGNEDFDLELDFAKEYMEQDANQTIILYQVDLERTKVNDVYNEASKGSIQFKMPIELPVVYEISDAELKAYGSKIQKGVYAQTGKLTFTVLISTLEEYGCDISRGDYIGVQIDSTHREYFTVTDDGRVGATANKQTLFGTKPIARTIVAASVDKNEFDG